MVVLATVWDALTVYVPVDPNDPVNCAVIFVPAVTPVPVMTESTVNKPPATAVTVNVVPEMEPVELNPVQRRFWKLADPEKLEAVSVPVTVTFPVNVDVPATDKLLPTATLPLASLTMLLTVPEGWMTLMVLRVLMDQPFTMLTNRLPGSSAISSWA